jgi:hypothetical protein
MSLSPFQFYMFAPAGELNQLDANDWLVGEPRSAFDARKLREAKLPGSSRSTYAARAKERSGGIAGPSLHESIATEGVKTPVRLHSGFEDDPEISIMNGHHRIVAQADIDPAREVPVEWIK